MFLQKLADKKIYSEDCSPWGIYFRKRWEQHFANHLAEAEKHRIHLFDTGWSCGYLWHLFSYEKADMLKEELAAIKFNKILKRNVYVFYQHKEEAYFIPNGQKLSAIDFQGEEDIYIVDDQFTWTFVVTHEKELGPYFYEKM